MARDGYGEEKRKQFENLTTVERGATSALSGRKVYDTDLDRIFVGDGSNWKEVANTDDLSTDYLEDNFISNIKEATANTSLTDTAATNPMKNTYGLEGLNFADLNYRVGRSRIEVYSIILTDEFLDGSPTYKIAAGCGPKGFRDHVRFVGPGWVNVVSAAAGAHVQTTVDGDYILVTGIMDDFSILVAPHANAPDDVDIVIDGVDTGTDLSLVQSSGLLTYNIRPNVIIADSSIRTALSSVDLHTVKITNSDSGADLTMNICGFELIVETAQEQAGNAFIGVTDTPFTQETVIDPTLSNEMGGLSYRYIDPADSTRKWSTREGTDLSTTLSAVFNNGTNSLTVADSTGFVVDDLVIVIDDSLGYDITEIFRVTVVPDGTHLTVQDNASHLDRTGAGHNFASGEVVKFYGKCDTAIDHSNEVIVRSSHPRRFGAGDSGDWQISAEGFAAVSFSLDDGSTSLYGDDSRLGSTTGQIQNQNGVRIDDTDGTDPILSFIFGGTGVAIDLNTGSSGLNSDDADIYLDGVKIKDAYASADSTILRLDLASGLPMGTHVLQIINRDATSGHDFGSIIRFIEYTLKDSSVINALGKGNLISKRYIPADYVFNSGTVSEDFSKGLTYYAPNRGWKCTDSSTAWGVTTEDIDFPFFKALKGEYDATAAVAETWFFGTGFELILERNANNGQPLLELDDSADFSGETLHYALTTDVEATNPMQLDAYAAAQSVLKFGVSGLTLGWHKLKVTDNNDKDGASGDTDLVILGLGVIGGSANIVEPTQSLQQISSCMIGDNQDIRKIKSLISEEDIVSYSEAIQITVNPTTTSSTYVPITDFSVSLRTKGNPVEVSYVCNCSNNGASNEYIILYIDGTEYQIPNYKFDTANFVGTVTYNKKIPLSAGIHVFTGYVKVGGNTETFHERMISVMELPGVKNEN